MSFRALCIFFSLILPLAIYSENAPMTLEGPWEDIRPYVSGDEKIETDVQKFKVDTPIRAEDAATVPVRFMAVDPLITIDNAVIVIDENPSPIAAEFKFGPAMQPLDFETRVRVNLYSNLRVAANSNGNWLMDGGFVKASGGCSAPATKSSDTNENTIGEMKIRTLPAPKSLPNSSERKSMQLMIRHPNYSGLQRDQITLLTIPAKFISELQVFQGDELLFSMSGGISISENPSFRFDYQDNGHIMMKIIAKDTDGNVFTSEIEKE